MTAPISRRSAELALRALEETLAAVERRNGGRVALAPDAVRALRELATAAASSDDLAASGKNARRPIQRRASSKWLEAAEVARRSGVKPRTLRWRAEHGKIPARRVAGRWLIKWPVETSKTEAA